LPREIIVRGKKLDRKLDDLEAKLQGLRFTELEPPPEEEDRILQEFEQARTWNEFEQTITRQPCENQPPGMSMADNFGDSQLSRRPSSGYPSPAPSEEFGDLSFAAATPSGRAALAQLHQEQLQRQQVFDAGDTIAARSTRRGGPWM